MKRKTKNIILITCMIILVMASGFTIKLAKDSVNTSTENIGQNMGEPPAKPDSNGESSDGKEPPAKPEKNGQNNASEPPAKPDSDNEKNASEPPAKPETDNGATEQQNGATEQQNNNSNQTMQASNMPGQSTTNNQASSDENMPNKMEANTSEKNTKVDVSYYILFGIEALAISALLAYCIMSNFNKKTLAMTLNSTKNVVLMIFMVAILTVILTIAQICISSKMIETNQTQNQEQMQMPSEMGKDGGATSNVTYKASKEITEDTTINNGEYDSSTADENALLIRGNINVNVSNAKITKTGDSNGGDATSFYGNNSAVLAKDGAKLELDRMTITTDANGANGVFSYGGSATTNNSSNDGTTVTIRDSSITTTGDNAGGIMTTGGGITNANNLTINTSGTSSAAIRSDRGGGTVNVEKGTYTTLGQGSPAVYSTANITVKDATLIAKASEGIVIEGANTVALENSDLTDSNTKLNGQSTTYKNIFLYQSMSGDASNGTATFTAKNSHITTNKGDTFYITNTTATINLENNTIVNNDSTGNFLRAQKDSWGKSGSNGGKVTLKMTNQKAEGNVVIDSISTLDMEMTKSSYYEGTINGANEAKSVTLKLDSSSKIKLTGDSYVTALEDADTTYSNIDFNGYHLYVNGVAIK